METNYTLAFAQKAMSLATDAAGVGMTLEYQGTRNTSFPWLFKKGWDRVKSFETADEAQAFIIGVSEGRKTR